MGIAPLFGRLDRNDAHASSGGRLTARRPPQGDGFAGDDAGRVAVTGTVLIHYPRHDLGVGPHVGSGDVALDPEGEPYAGGESPGQVLHLGVRHLQRVAGDATFGAAEGDVDQRGLPGHERGEGADFIEVDLGMVAEPPLHGPARATVLHAVADEDLETAAIHAHRDLYLQLPERGLQDKAHVLVQIEEVGGVVEQLVRVLVAVGWLGRGHHFSEVGRSSFCTRLVTFQVPPRRLRVQNANPS